MNFTIKYNIKIEFGKYKNQYILDVIKNNPSYFKTLKRIRVKPENKKNKQDLLSVWDKFKFRKLNFFNCPICYDNIITKRKRNKKEKNYKNYIYLGCCGKKLCCNCYLSICCSSNLNLKCPLCRKDLDLFGSIQKTPYLYENIECNKIFFKSFKTDFLKLYSRSILKNINICINNMKTDKYLSELDSLELCNEFINITNKNNKLFRCEEIKKEFYDFIINYLYVYFFKLMKRFLDDDNYLLFKVKILKDLINGLCSKYNNSNIYIKDEENFLFNTIFFNELNEIHNIKTGYKTYDFFDDKKLSISNNFEIKILEV